MKYWLLTTEFPPDFGGGISTYSHETAGMMSRAGHEVTVFVLDKSLNTSLSESQANGFRIVRFSPGFDRSFEYLGYPAYISRVFSSVIAFYLRREEEPDILEAQDYNAISYYLLQFKWQGIEPFANLKIIVTCHSPSFICNVYNQVPAFRFPEYWTGEMEKACLLTADLLIFPSEYIQTELSRHIDLSGVPKCFLPNPLSAVQAPLTSTPQDENCVVSFGKLSPLKGSFAMLNTFRQLWDEGLETRLVIVGGTDYFVHTEGRTMKDLVRSGYGEYINKGLLQLAGKQNKQEVDQWLAKAKFVLVPSLYDNFPYTVLETMQQGAVVLASVQGGQREIIRDGENGFLFDHNIPGDMKLKIRKVLDIKAGERQKISESARLSAQQYSHPDIVAKRKLNILENCRSRSLTANYYPFLTRIPKTPRAHADPGEPGLLSVVIPHYNLGEYLKDCLDSIVASTYQPIEMIIVDDGSTDPTSTAILEKWEKKYPVRVIRKENEGLAKARNTGAELARGEFLAFLDADDTVSPDYYARALLILKKFENIAFVGSWLRYAGESEGIWPTFNPEPPYLLAHNMVNSSGLVFRRTAFLQFGKNDARFEYGLEDWDAVIGLVRHGQRGVVIPEPLFHYRVRKGSMSRQFTTDKLLHTYSLLAKKHAGFFNSYAIELAQLLQANGPGLYFDNPSFPAPAYRVSGNLAKIKNRARQIISRYPRIRKTAYFIYKKYNTRKHA